MREHSTKSGNRRHIFWQRTSVSKEHTARQDPGMDAGIAAVGADRSGNAGIDPGRLPTMTHTKTDTDSSAGDGTSMKTEPIAGGKVLSMMIEEKKHAARDGAGRLLTIVTSSSVPVAEIAEMTDTRDEAAGNAMTTDTKSVAVGAVTRTDTTTVAVRIAMITDMMSAAAAAGPAHARWQSTAGRCR